MPTAVPPIGFSATCTINGSPLSFPIMFEAVTGTNNVVDISYMGQSVKDKLFVVGMRDNGPFNFTALYCEADWRTLWALRSGTAATIVLTFPDDGTGGPPTQTFSAIMIKHPMKFEMEGIPHIEVEMKISGAITLG